MKRPQPNCAYIHSELKRKHVTMDLLWREYKEDHVEGLQYSTFCENYRKWAGKLNVWCDPRSGMSSLIQHCFKSAVSHMKMQRHKNLCVGETEPCATGPELKAFGLTRRENTGQLL